MRDLNTFDQPPNDQGLTKVEPLYFVQFLRFILIVLVVAHHAGQPYGPTGGDWPVDDPVGISSLGLFFMFNAAFFMGFFFLISGYFVSASYDSKGGANFLFDRVIRLGLPLIFTTVFVFGSISFFSADSQTSYFSFLLYQYIGQWQIEMGHLWFLAQLLALCIIYTLYRIFFASKIDAKPVTFAAPDNSIILKFTIVLGLTGAIIRVFYEQDYWVNFLGVIPIEVVHAPQYWSLFIVGIFAGQGRWFETLPDSLGIKWFMTGLITFVLMVSLRPVLVSTGMSAFGLTPAASWNILWGFFEAFVCIGLIVGLLIFSRHYFSKPSKWLRHFDRNIFGIYIIHVFVLVGIQQALLSLELSALAKFSIAGSLGLLFSYIDIVLLRLIPGVKRII